MVWGRSSVRPSASGLRRRGARTQAFGATETAAARWIASAVLKLKDAGIDADSIKDNAVNIIIATVMGVIAFAE